MKGNNTIKGYVYQCSYCKTEQVVYFGKSKRPKKKIQGFCAKDTHRYTELRYVRELVP